MANRDFPLSPTPTPVSDTTGYSKYFKPDDSNRNKKEEAKKVIESVRRSSSNPEEFARRFQPDNSNKKDEVKSYFTKTKNK